MEPFLINVDNNLINKMKKFYNSQMIVNDDEKILFIAKTVGCSIVCYTDYRVEFKGINAATELQRWQKKQDKNFPTIEEGIYTGGHIGACEYGSLDYFGPMCVVACYVDDKDIEWLQSMDLENVTNLSDVEIVNKGRLIKDKIVYSLLLLDNTHYNQAIANGINQANVKAKLHNDAMTNVIQKTQQSTSIKVVEQFISSKTYYNYLKNEVVVVKDAIIEQNAYQKYLAVRCSYVIARYAYLQYHTNMFKSLKIKLLLFCF